MDFEWDYKKAESNLSKHRVDFADAVSIFYELNAVTLKDIYEEEQRFISIEIDCLGRVLVVVYTCRGETIRIISARKANKRERRTYADS